MRFRFFIIPFIVLLTIAVSIWWFFDATNAIWIILTLVAGYSWAGWKLDPERKDWWRFAIIPWLMAVTILFFSILISGVLLYVLLAVLSVLLQIIYWRQLLTYTSESTSYIPFSLERLSFSYNFLILFFATASIFGFKRFLDIPEWILWPTFAICLAILIAQRLWLTDAHQNTAWRLATTIFIAVMELFIVASFLPLDFRLLAFLVAAAYYGFVSYGFGRSDQEVSQLHVRLLLIIITLGCLAVLATARWY